MRRRRNELEYPHIPGETASTDEAGQAITDTTSLITAAEQLLGQLTFFKP